MIHKRRNGLIVSIGVTGFLFLFIQINFVNHVLALGPYRPDLLAILTAFVGFRLGPVAGSTFGFWAGLILDGMTGFLGPQALTKTAIGFTATFFANQRVLLVEKYYFPIVMVLLALAHDVAVYWIHSLGSNLSFVSMVFEYGLVNALYTGLIAFLLLMLIPPRILRLVRHDVKYEL
jgi:rod shape-determining protein MreD